MTSIEPFVGEIALFGYNFAPRGWALCNGQLLPIATNTALFSILGVRYGGNGTTSFALPNLNGRAALGAGQGAGLSRYALGETGGQATVQLDNTHIPAHRHTTQATAATATTPSPGGAVPAKGDVSLYNTQPTAQEMLQPTGGGQPHNNMQPSLGMLYCIALQGVFPQRP